MSIGWATMSLHLTLTRQSSANFSQDLIFFYTTFQGLLTLENRHPHFFNVHVLKKLGISDLLPHIRYNTDFLFESDRSLI